MGVSATFADRNTACKKGVAILNARRETTGLTLCLSYFLFLISCFLVYLFLLIFFSICV